MKVVIDTNILLVSVSPRSKSHWVYQKLISGEYTLCVSTEVLLEYEEIFEQKLGRIFAETVMNVLDNLPNIMYVHSYIAWDLIKADVDDNKFVDCAIAAGADYLTTNDTHFNIVKSIPFPKVNIVSLIEFYNIIFKL
jgi:uncharacterized protein